MKLEKVLFNYVLTLHANVYTKTAAIKFSLAFPSNSRGFESGWITSLDYLENLKLSQKPLHSFQLSTALKALSLEKCCCTQFDSLWNRTSSHEFCFFRRVVFMVVSMTPTSVWWSIVVWVWLGLFIISWIGHVWVWCVMLDLVSLIWLGLIRLCLVNLKSFKKCWNREV